MGYTQSCFVGTELQPVGEVYSYCLVRRQLTASRASELKTDCELFWVKVVLHGCKALYVGAYYKPEEADEQRLVEYLAIQICT